MSFTPLFAVIFGGILSVTLAVAVTGQSATAHVVLSVALLVLFAIAVAFTSGRLLGDEDGSGHDAPAA